MPRPLRLIHTSDLHLDAYVGNDEPVWEERRGLMRAAFQCVLAAVREHQADALLIVGDLFDSARARPETVEWFLAQCAAIAPTPVIAINGNHDTLGERSVYQRLDPARAPNLQLLLAPEGRRVLLEELDLVVWGRGYDERDLGFRPLEGLPARRDGHWHVALAHGHYVRGEADAHRSQPIRPEEIAESDWDYVALGHWEPHEDVSTGSVIAVYSGAPMPISDINTRAGWVMVVDCDPRAGVTWRRENVDPRRSSGTH